MAARFRYISGQRGSSSTRIRIVLGLGVLPVAGLALVALSYMEPAPSTLQDTTETTGILERVHVFPTGRSTSRRIGLFVGGQEYRYGASRESIATLVGRLQEGRDIALWSTYPAVGPREIWQIVQSGETLVRFETTRDRYILRDRRTRQLGWGIFGLGIVLFAGLTITGRIR